MQRDADAVREELANIDRIRHHLDCCHQAFRREQRTGWFQLPRGQPVAHYSVRRDFERSDSIEKRFLRWLEQREIGFVINHLDSGRRFFARLGALELHIILVCNQVRCHEDTAFRQNCAERAL